MKNIGLIEDDSVLVNAYSKYFKITKTFNIAFSVPDVSDALNLAIADPHIILLDINLRSGSGIDGIKALAQHFPKSSIVILSSLEDAKLTRLALENGAVGYLLKSSSLAYITESLLKLDEGGIPFSPVTISHLMQGGAPTLTEPDTAGLTKRELELIKLLSEGLANKTAAHRLNVTYFTINQHLKNIYKKLKINSKSELIAWYLNKS
ncbi:response regulator [Mucilaginibacter agri]|uniref:Response regulator n=1 Tax=Mucilaginibacter agri TaxID=2695265 RepID=A0A966DR66_9SPHI|nr:response regulator transcription factor [Mucilaginibacter agri]NCD68723.1 response regulator [Mucilaginibacter agri]